MTTFGFKTRIMIGTWNVRTLSDPSRIEQLCKEMSNYKLSILGLSETRILNSGSTHLSSGHHLLFSGNSNTKVRGVGILLTPYSSRCLIEFKPISDRLIVARFSCRFRNISVIQCYAPTEPDDDSSKDEFYSQLDTTIHSLPGGDIKILIGDFNAKVGSDNANLESIMGKNGLGDVRNDNGERLVDLCARHSLFIGGTRFLHKDIHKYTWESPDQNTRNQIDHVIISKLFVGSLEDVRTRRGADLYTDHELLVGTFRLRPAAIKQHKHVAKFNTSRFQDPSTSQLYRNTLSLKLPADVDSEQSWDDIVEACKQAAKDVIGHVDKRRKQWISDETWAEIKNRKHLKNIKNKAKTPEGKNAAKLQYRQSASRVKTLVRLDKEKYYNSVAEETERAANTGNMKQVYASIKKLSGNNIRSTATIKDGNGNLLTAPDQQLNRWREFFTENATSQNTDTVNEQQQPSRRNQRRDISTAPPSVSEIKLCIEKLKNGKSAGPDDIPAELIKYGAPILAERLAPIINKVWTSNQIPNEWKEGVVITIPKKGDLSDCKNWRGITLLNAISKLLATILLGRIAPAVDLMLRNEQAGFRTGRSCADHINTLRIIIEQTKEYNTHLYLLFVDFERAFDTVSRDLLWRTLSSKGIPDKIVTLIRELYRESSSRVRFNGKDSQPFSSTTGVKQGCILSPTLFLLLLDSVLEKTNTEAQNGIQWNISEKLNDIDYADDICLMAHRFNDIEDKLKKLSVNAMKFGLKINLKKTKLMRIGTSSTTPLKLENVVIEDVESFNYLGSVITKDGGTTADIRSRINKARVAFQSMHKLWKSNSISSKTKLRIFDCSVKSVLLYGSTTWGVTQTNMKKLQGFVNRCLRRILCIFWPNTISTTELLQLTENTTIEAEIMKRKWTWIGHILRRPQNDITRAALQWNPQGHRRPGRPQNTWMRTINRECSAVNKSWNQIKALANNRSRWREIVNALCSPELLF